jgi:hypothetical protein
MKKEFMSTLTKAVVGYYPSWNKGVFDRTSVLLKVVGESFEKTQP